MANHSAQPTTRVEVRHSPGAVQGLAALEEVADVDSLRDLVSEPSCLQLVAGPAGIR
jgi:hypothetical protein